MFSQYLTCLVFCCSFFKGYGWLVGHIPACYRMGGRCLNYGSSCSGPSPANRCPTGQQCCLPGTVKYYACHILGLAKEGKLELWNKHASGVDDNAFAITNVEDTCSGKEASRSRHRCKKCRRGAPGGTVPISVTVLKYIYNLANSGTYLRVREIAGGCHSCSSKNYRGLGVDIQIDPKRKTAYLNQCKSLGGRFINKRTHYNCSFRI